jgi:hypothetical protein
MAIEREILIAQTDARDGMKISENDRSAKERPFDYRVSGNLMVPRCHVPGVADEHFYPLERIRRLRDSRSQLLDVQPTMLVSSYLRKRCGGTLHPERVTP